MKRAKPIPLAAAMTAGVKQLATEVNGTQARKVHPAADLFPMLEGPELEQLAADIKKNGLLHPIVLLGDQVIDGRNRLRACEIAGIEPDYKEVRPDDVVAFVVSANLERRHLTTTQRAAIAAELAKLDHGGARNFKGSNEPLNQRAAPTLAESAKLLKVSRASVVRAKKTLKTDPAAHEAAKAGKPKRRAPSSAPGSVPKPKRLKKTERAEQGAAIRAAFEPIVAKINSRAARPVAPLEDKRERAAHEKISATTVAPKSLPASARALVADSEFVGDLLSETERNRDRTVWRKAVALLEKIPATRRAIAVHVVARSCKVEWPDLEHVDAALQEQIKALAPR